MYKVKELESLYEDRLSEDYTPEELAQEMTDELSPKQLAELSLSDCKSLHWNAGGELPPVESIRDYFFNLLKDMGENLVDPIIIEDFEKDKISGQLD